MIQAIGRFTRISPRKMQLIASAVKKLPLPEALERLSFSNKKGAPLLKDVVESAIANAKNNLNIDKNNLFIKQIEVTQGTAFKRWRAVSRGAAHEYKKRTSHIRVVLDEIKSTPLKDKPQIKEKIEKLPEKITKESKVKARKNGS